MASAQAGQSNGASSSESRVYSDPPRFFDGRPSLLDRSYTRVEHFGPRPGGAPRPPRRTRRSSNASNSSSAHSDDEDLNRSNDGLNGAGPSSRSINNSTRPSSNTLAAQDDHDQDEWEYEDLPPELVIFDLGAHSEQLMRTAREWSMVGLETDQPFLKVGATMLKGEWQETVGTGIVLLDETDTTRRFPHQHQPRPLTPPLPSLTHNSIRFRQVLNQDAADERSQRRLERAKEKYNIDLPKTQGGRPKKKKGKKSDKSKKGKERATSSASADGTNAAASDQGDQDDSSSSSSEEEEEDNNSPTREKRRPGRPSYSTFEKAQRAVERALKGEKQRTGRETSGEKKDKSKTKKTKGKDKDKEGEGEDEEEGGEDADEEGEGDDAQQEREEANDQSEEDE